MVSLASEHGITLCHENESEIYGQMPAEVRDILENVRGLGGIFDPANYRMNGADVMAGIEATLINFKYFHIKDAIYEEQKIVPAGEGEGRIGEIINIVDRHTDDYVFLTLEPHLKLFSAYTSIDNHTLRGNYEFTTNAEAFDFEAVIPMVAKNGKGVDILISECEKFLHESEWFFPDDIVTDQPERQIAAEIIREKLLRMLEEEIPHGTAVTIEEWKEEGRLVSIRAEIYCEKASHKGIIIGKGGSLIKKIGSYARQDIEQMLDSKVFLDLYVRVKENWRDSGFNISDFGFKEEE
jgi:GTP-binding protein Era